MWRRKRGGRCLQREGHGRDNEGVKRGTKEECEASNCRIIWDLHVRKKQGDKRGKFATSGESEVVFLFLLSTFFFSPILKVVENVHKKKHTVTNLAFIIT